MSDGHRRVAVVAGAEEHAPAGAWATASSAEAALESGAEAVLVPADVLRALCSGHSEAAERRLAKLRHDLNNDLTAVMGFSQLLVRARDELPEKVVGRAERIFQHARLMTERIAASRDEVAAPAAAAAAAARQASD